MKSRFSQYRYYNGNRWISGTAAYNHFFKENGGIDHVLTSIAVESAQHAIRRFMSQTRTRKR